MTRDLTWIVMAAGLILLAPPPSAAGQDGIAGEARVPTRAGLDRSGPEQSWTRVQEGNRSTGSLVAGALLGAGAGWLVGGGVGAIIGGNTCRDPGNPDSCRGLEGAFVGANLAQAITIPLGVHLMNGRRGRYGRALLLTTAVTAGGMLAIHASDSGPLSVGIALSLPVSHIVGSVLIETRTARASEPH